MAFTIAADVCEALRVRIDAILKDVKRAAENGMTMNEAQTEAIVIDRILDALGYGVWEYQKRGVSEGVGIIPDYTILPNTADQWFLEAKKWKLPLTEREELQAVTYAFNHGARWAILTNGDEWRIFDAHSTVPLSQKCIMKLLSLTSPDAVEVLALLSKEHIKMKVLDYWYRQKLIVDAVKAEVTTLESETVKALRRAVANKLPIQDVTKPEVAEALRELGPVHTNRDDLQSGRS